MYSNHIINNIENDLISLAIESQWPIMVIPIIKRETMPNKVPTWNNQRIKMENFKSCNNNHEVYCMTKCTIHHGWCKSLQNAPWWSLYCSWPKWTNHYYFYCPLTFVHSNHPRLESHTWVMIYNDHIILYFFLGTSIQKMRKYSIMVNVTPTSFSSLIHPLYFIYYVPLALL